MSRIIKINKKYWLESQDGVRKLAKVIKKHQILDTPLRYQVQILSNQQVVTVGPAALHDYSWFEEWKVAVVSTVLSVIASVLTTIGLHYLGFGGQ